MRQGLYTIDSIEKGKAKLLWREDESIEELVSTEELGYSAKQGDIIDVAEQNGKPVFAFQQTKTESIKEQARKIKEELLKRNME